MSSVCRWRVSYGGIVAGFGLLALGCDSGFESQIIKRFGSVSVGSSAVPGWAPKPFGMFYRVADQTEQAGCEVTVDNGTCRAWACDDAVYQRDSSLKTVTAGSVVVNSPSQTVELAPDEAGFYRQPDAPTSFWDQGDSISVVIEGSADFPGLEASWLAPAPLTVTAPELSEPLVIDKTQDLPLIWSGAETSSVFVTISPETVASEGAAPIVTPGIDCEFAAVAGKAFAPATFLEQLPAPATLTQYYLDVVTYSYTSAESGDAWVDFRATWVGLSTPATLQ